MEKDKTEHSFFGITAISAIASGIRLLSLFLLSKLSALWLGPSGLLFMGQLQNIYVLSQSIGSRSMHDGIVRYSSEYRNDPIKFQPYLSSALLFSFAGTVVWAIILVIFKSPLINILNSSLDLTHLWYLIIPAILLMSLNILITATLQGAGHYFSWLSAVTLFSILQLIITALGIYLKGTKGLFFALAILPITQLAISLPLYFYHYKNIFKIKSLMPTINHIHSMKQYLIMGIASISLPPLSLLIVRTTLANSWGTEIAGEWQGLLKLSEIGTTAVTALFATWYLPSLAAAKLNIHQQGVLIRKVLLYAGSIAAIGITIILLLKTNVILFALSEQFLPVTSYMNWQLSGDFFRVVGWALGVTLIIKGDTKLFLITELFSQLLFVFFSLLLMKYSGAKGVAQGYFLESAIYFFYMCVITRKALFYFTSKTGI